jgi:hypothetical protein
MNGKESKDMLKSWGWFKAEALQSAMTAASNEKGFTVSFVRLKRSSLLEG